LLLRIGDIEKKYRISHNTIKAWESSNLIKSYRTVGKHRRYLEEDILKLLDLNQTNSISKVAIYGRTSTQKQKENLDRQMERLREYCKEKGYKDVIEFSEIASGLNDNRRQLHQLFKLVIKGEINTIVIEYKDRLARFGLSLIISLLEGYNCKVEIIEEKATESENEELVNDLLSVVTSFSARIYGKRGGRKKLKEELNV